ncbi:RIO1-domain-containing protein [Polyplosphaeria fusca]|uniref:Serine/threonine-protein kinase RIO2 n=1 Tax=Polyplosphaeria fusca TaxID=682080 RepID=A0A9P4V596_9PLEO|nr:RIO1-domain-containing protein [Polyplosphaeria fusca]
MKLNVKNIRYVSPDDWRVLTATEQGSRNHSLVPVPLITQLASLRSGGVTKCISSLAKLNLIAKVKNAKYDGYRLTYGGLDYLALHAHTKSSTVYSVGNQIGVGKESDIYVCADASGTQLVLKLHRLGRISFRTVKANRDYLRHRSSASWMYMSRLAAIKEHEFMRVLHREGFPVPVPVSQNRHTLVMSLINAFPLRQISAVGDPATLYAELLDLIVRLAAHGLIHGDFNEFNILISEQETDTGGVALVPTIIDFPQMLSISHPNAPFYFDRDVACIKRYFSRRFGFTSDDAGPFFADATRAPIKRLDVEVEASGFSRKMAKELESYMRDVGVDGDAQGDGPEKEDSEDDSGAEAEAEEAETEVLQHEHDDTEPTHQITSLASGMTVLDVRDTDTDPLPSLDQLQLPLQQPAIQPSPVSTKAAKAKAGWAI